MENLKVAYANKNLILPLAALTPFNPTSLNNYIDGEIKKLNVKYARNKIKLGLIHLAHQTLSDSSLLSKSKERISNCDDNNSKF